MVLHLVCLLKNPGCVSVLFTLSPENLTTNGGYERCDPFENHI